METKIDLIIDTKVVQKEFDRLFSCYEVHYVRKKVILFFKLNKDLKEHELTHSHMQFLLTEIIDGLQIQGYSRVPNNQTIESRIKHFESKSTSKDVSFLCICLITFIGLIVTINGEKLSFMVFLVMLIMLFCVLQFIRIFLSLTTYGLKSIKRDTN